MTTPPAHPRKDSTVPDDRLFTMPRRTGGTLAVQCPPWCSQRHSPKDYVEWAWHEGPAIEFTGPGDYYEHFDGGEPYEVMWACIAAEPDHTTGTYGRPYIYFDTLSAGQGGRLDVEQADALIADLRTYTDRLQQLRDHLAQITDTQGEQ